MTKQSDKPQVNPGPKSEPEQAHKASIEAFNLLQAIMPLNLPYAAEYIDKNPPTADAIAMLGFIAYRALSSERYSQIAKKPRKSRIQGLRDLHNEGVINLETDYYQDVRAKAPEFVENFTSDQIQVDIAKIKRELKEKK